ncbi:hypothetical protein A2685_03250 [Candidatus Woesebacteria bacterium RIFCSPHIGHO2_01_FULL_37_10]|uniref:Uncharacterized protein n=1 Tax=Candidatus Woesebacteria bacterium RIFCSPHIGHO2_01_FULL_37_10 TaxID=1802489 RepID=A0A1F7XXX9_9BACT|nr:MAG: hypothetical protein A2685_03250 [Candidatus Woesebacteria bacterium RIFCSPHIGHO2_01_FULL_37_10]
MFNKDKEPRTSPILERLNKSNEFNLGKTLGRIAAGHIVLTAASVHARECEAGGRLSEATFIRNFAMRVFDEIINPAPPPEESTPKS